MDSSAAPLVIWSYPKHRVAANALMGVQRALLDQVRRRILAGEDPVRLAADIRASTRQALALLEHGLGDYGAGPPRR